MTVNHNPYLPRLPFGERIADIERNPKSYADRLALFNTALNGYEPLGSVSEFKSKSTVIHINGMKLVAAANTPLHIDFGTADALSLLIPFHGAVDLDADGRSHKYGVTQGAMLLPAIGRRGRSSMGSSLILQLCPKRMQETARSMLGADASESVSLGLDLARTLPLQHGKIAFDAMFRNLCSLIDNLSIQPEALEHLGLDDVMYRNAVLMSRPELFVDAETDACQRPCSTTARKQSVDSVIAYIELHLTDRITLSDLERVSGASARLLQYAFLARFGCGPMDWMRKRRMDLARTRLLASRGEESITQIALECGFHSPSRFSLAYKTMYGELPSATVRP